MKTAKIRDVNFNIYLFNQFNQWFTDLTNDLLTQFFDRVDDRFVFHNTACKNNIKTYTDNVSRLSIFQTMFI